MLAPVRVVPRKGLEHAVELVARLERSARFVVSHAAGDEGMAYEARIREFARLLDVDVLWAADRVADFERSTDDEGRPLYSLGDMYDACDLVAYSSLIEGFGNAYLEAVYHRKPVFVNRYPIYDVDIRPKGFRNVEMNGFVTEAVVEETRAVLEDPLLIAEWAETNYAAGLRHFSHRPSAMASALSSRSCSPRSNTPAPTPPTRRPWRCTTSCTRSTGCCSTTAAAAPTTS